MRRWWVAGVVPPSRVVHDQRVTTKIVERGTGMAERSVAPSVLAGGGAAGPRSERLRILLVEDDEGDAFLVSELLHEEDPSIVVRHVRSLAEALDALAAEPPDCVLLDLGLPDASGLGALDILRAAHPGVAHLVLTGDRDVHRGVEAVAAGAQDYLIKGSVDGDGLRRAVLYAVERRSADGVRQQLRAAEMLAEEATRLERGLLPVPLLNDSALGVGTGYRPGRERTLLGGDFFDAVEVPDGTVHLVIGDVAGHGPDEAALGVCLRVAWRTQMLGAAAPDAVLPTLQRVLVHERYAEEIFATVLTVIVSPDRRTAALRSAGHPPPVLLGDAGPTALELSPGLPLGVFDDASWPVRFLALPPAWGLLLATDGLIEGRAGPDAPGRLGMEGLIGLLAAPEADSRWVRDPAGFVAGIIDEVMRRNGGVPLDDVAALLLTGRQAER
jgi:serine phosphatase RsbU (regulator of sigma subunit)